VNSSQVGTYKFADGTRVYTAWYQDDSIQQLTIQLAKYDVDGYEVIYYFTSSGFYYYYYDGTATCTYSTSSNYYDECFGYGSDYLAYLSTIKFINSRSERPVYLYVGYAPDAVGYLNVEMYVDTATGLYSGLTIVSDNTDGSTPAWSQYWYYHLTSGLPKAEHFVLPTACLSATTSSVKLSRTTLGFHKDLLEKNLI